MLQESVLRLFWIDVDATEPPGWSAALAPEVALTVLGAGRATAADVLAAAGDRPYALLGFGRTAVPAFELARTLIPAPACLIVAGAAAPGAGEVSCPVVAFLPAGADGDELAGRWRERSAAELAVRRLPADFRDAPARHTVLMVKEELRVWPN
jgi:hypothetical protein